MNLELGNSKIGSIIKAFLWTVIYATVLINVSLLVTQKCDFSDYVVIILSLINLFLVSGLLILMKSMPKMSNNITLPQLAFYSFLGFLFVLFQGPLGQIYNFFFESNYNIHPDWVGRDRAFNLNSIAFILIIPLVEEFFFRGFIQKNLQTVFNPITAIVLSAFFFCLIHSPYMDFFSDYINEDWFLAFVTFLVD